MTATCTLPLELLAIDYSKLRAPFTEPSQDIRVYTIEFIEKVKYTQGLHGLTYSLGPSRQNRLYVR